MRRALLAGLLLLAAPASAAASPEQESTLPDQTVVFYNARVALREDRYADVLKLWLLRNSLLDQGKPPTHDDDFASVVWAALGEQGICSDGFSRDRDGAGLWPLALHNWVLQESRRGQPPQSPPPYPAFEVARQRRKVSLHDVLSVGELRTVTFRRTDCFAAFPYLLEEGEAPWKSLRDRTRAALVMRRLLSTSLSTVDRSRVQSTAVIEARIFDLDLAILQLEGRDYTRKGLEQARKARMVGVSEAGADEVRDAHKPDPPAESHRGKLLQRTLKWSVDDWMSLSRARRLFLFDRARSRWSDPEALDRLMLGLIDDRIENKEGVELEMWIGSFGADSDERRAALYAGERGARLVQLDADAGFGERSVIALHRGVDFLASGQTEEALRSFAFAMAHAEESRDAATVLALSRRWLSYTLSVFETNEDILAIVQELVPRQEYNAVIDDLVWRAALRADSKSFDLAISGMRRGGAYDLKVSRLRLLSRGRAGALASTLRRAAVKEPNLTVRFIGEIIERIEAEDAEVRAANAPLLRELVRVLVPLASYGKRKSSSRAAEKHLDRAHAILEGLHQLDTSSARTRARTQSPDRDTFAGAVRLAPADPLPWPFVAPEPEAPAVFTPISLEPVEWQNEDGEPVFGWRISDAAE